MTRKRSDIHNRAKLTVATVLEIYRVRPPLGQSRVGYTHVTREIANHFSIVDRTVRDIWNRRSWRSTTRPLWTAEEILMEKRLPEKSSSLSVSANEMLSSPSPTLRDATSSTASESTSYHDQEMDSSCSLTSQTIVFDMPSIAKEEHPRTAPGHDESSNVQDLHMDEAVPNENMNSPQLFPQNNLSILLASISSTPVDSDSWLRGLSQRDPFQDDWSGVLSRLRDHVK